LIGVDVREVEMMVRSGMLPRLVSRGRSHLLKGDEKEWSSVLEERVRHLGYVGYVG